MCRVFHPSLLTFYDALLNFPDDPRVEPAIKRDLSDADDSVRHQAEEALKALQNTSYREKPWSGFLKLSQSQGATLPSFYTSEASSAGLSSSITAGSTSPPSSFRFFLLLLFGLLFPSPYDVSRTKKLVFCHAGI